jgi:hypothetical protein
LKAAFHQAFELIVFQNPELPLGVQVTFCCFFEEIFFELLELLNSILVTG